MRPLLNTLYVLTPDVYIRKDGLNVVILREDKETFRIPIMNLESIVCFNYMGASPGVMKLCVDNHVDLSFLTPHRPPRDTELVVVAHFPLPVRIRRR